jgi:hypothetical protein
VLALVNGLPGRDLVLVVLLDVVLLVALWLVDETRSRTPVTRVMRITLDHAVGGVAEATAAVRDRLDLDPLDVVIEDVDLVRETTRVAVRYAAPAGSWRPLEPDPSDPSQPAPATEVLDAR